MNRSRLSAPILALQKVLHAGLTASCRPRLRRSPVAGAFLDGVNVASLALMATVTWYLARTALVDVVTFALGLLSVVLLIRFRVNSAWLVLAGALIGAGRLWLP